VFGKISAAARDPIVYDLDWDEDERLADWRRVVDRTVTLPPALAAAGAITAWHAIEPLQHTPWLGRLLAAAMLRARGKTRARLSCLGVGLRAIPSERRRVADQAQRIVAWLEAQPPKAGSRITTAGSPLDRC
jgi:hypothetical protein